jgi:hypothetical protein
LRSMHLTFYSIACARIWTCIIMNVFACVKKLTSDSKLKDGGTV